MTPAQLDDFTDEEFSSAALSIIGPLPHAQQSWIGGTLEQCDGVKAKIAELRAKYSTYEPVRMRRAINEWLDFAAREEAKARADVISQKTRNEQNAYRAKEAARRERTRALLDRLP